MIAHRLCLDRVVTVCVAYSLVNMQMDPPQIATEVFSSGSLSEWYPEQYTKNVEKSRRANIIFFGQNPTWQLQT